MAADDVAETKQVEKDDESVSWLFSYYSDTATMHGVHQVAGKRLYAFRRYLWVFLMAGMFCGLTIMMYFHFQRYSSHPTVTVVNAHVQDSLEFPAVTICNLNQFHADRIPADPKLRELLYLLSDYAVLTDYLRPADTVGETKPGSKVDTGEQLRMFAMNAAHRLNDMFKYCVWSSKVKPCAEMFNATVTDLGVCYTFNADPSTSRLLAHDSGPMSGLRVILDIQQDAYYYSLHTQSGLKVLLHEPDEAPLLSNKGFYVRPGTCTDVVIRKEKRTSLPAPYKAFGENYCLHTRSEDFRNPLTRYRNYSYTESACWQNCFVDRLVEACGCRSVFGPGDERFCSIEEMKTCFLPKAGETTVEDVASCDCQKACTEVTYPTSISFTNFASKFIIRQLFNDNLLTDEYYVRDNLIEMRIYYDSLIVSEVLQEPEMTVIGILGDVGGHMGLFLGASILSVTEILEVIMLAVFTCSLGKWGLIKKTPGHGIPHSATEVTTADRAGSKRSSLADSTI